MPLRKIWNNPQLRQDERRTATIDMVDNMQNIMDLYNQMQQNPIQLLSRKFNIPQNINNPNDIIQHLLNSGQVTQTQVNNAMQMANNPMFKKMFGK